MRFLGIFSCLCLMPFLGHAQSVELVPTSVPLDQINRSIPMDATSILTDAQISLIPRKDTPPLDPNLLGTIIDTDRTTGVILSPQKEYDFLLSQRAVEQLGRLTIVGSLNGATVTVRVSEMPILPGERGWKEVIKGKPLQAPVTSLQFRPQASFCALITIKTSISKDDITLNDISFYPSRDQDVREFDLVVNPSVQPEASTSDISSQSTAPETQFDLASMYAKATITYTTGINLATFGQLNDGDAATPCEFDPKHSESVIILDLGQSRRVCKASIVHSKQAGDLSVYLARELPWKSALSDSKNISTLAWLNPTWGTMNDSPVFGLYAEMNSPARKLPPQIKLDSTWFESLTKIGASKTDESTFSTLTAKTAQGRYIVLRYVNRSLNSPIGLRLYDLNVFGDYPTDAFKLVSKPLPEIETDALITAKPPPAAEGASVDLSKVRNAVPPPTSPSSP